MQWASEEWSHRRQSRGAATIVRVDLGQQRVIEAAALFRSDADTAKASAGDLHFVAADARRFVVTATDHHDVIVADNFHPARGGSGALTPSSTSARCTSGRPPEACFAGGCLSTMRSIVVFLVAAFP
jgi:spermidine synthase